jgi:hypothetical protein
MKQLSIVTAVLLALAAAPAFADRDRSERIDIRLSGLQEVPSVSTPGRGTFDATINEEGTHIDWELTYSDMQADVTQAHIHIAQRSVNGGIVLWLCKTTQTAPTANICPVRAGTVSGTFTAADVQAQAAQGIAAMELSEVIAMMRAGRAYANVHTAQSPGGEIRGQVSVRRGHHHHGHDRDD